MTLGSASGQFNFDHLNSDINDKLKNFKIKKLDVKLELNTNAKYNIEKLWEVSPQKNSLWTKSFIDLQNDVTTKDIRQAITEGFDRINI